MKLYEPLPKYIIVNRRKYRLNLDFRNVLKMLDVLENEDILLNVRDYVALKCVMRRVPKDVHKAMLLVKILLFGDVKSTGGKRVTSFEQDADMIRAAFWQEYGINLYRDKLHWFEFTALLYNMPDGNKYSEVIGIRGRTVPPPDKYNKHEREWLIIAQAEYALKLSDKERERSYSNSLRRVFNDMKNIANGK